MDSGSPQAPPCPPRVRPRILLAAAALALGMVLPSRALPLSKDPGSLPPPAPASGAGEGRYVPGEVLVRFKPGVSGVERGRARSEVAARKEREFRSRAEHWRLPPGLSTEEAIARLRRNPHVEYAEPNYIVRAALVPNDASYSLLWGLHNTGQTGGFTGADIAAEAAWSVSTGDAAVRVGVLDSGIDISHPDLAANIWTNPGEIPGNGADDDGNGFVDDVHGWDFVNDDNDPLDDFGHGTHVAGTIGAAGNNGIGVTGVAWQVSLVPLKFLNSAGSGPTSAAVEAIDYTVRMGVDVLNNSWGSYEPSQALVDAILGAAGAEVVFVAAAGNNGTSNDSVPFYPASYDLPNVISVAATDHYDIKAGFSNYGGNSVDLGAPGVDIFSTLPDGRYGLLSGTSMAAPHVAGTAALIRAVAPGIPAFQVKQKILDLAAPVPALAGLVLSGGRLNAFFPIATRDDVPPGPIDDLLVSFPTSNTIVLRWTATGDDGDDGRALTYDVRYAPFPIDAANFETLPGAPGAPLPAPSGSIETMEVAGLEANTTYYFAVRARDEWGNPGPFGNAVSGLTLPPPTFDSTPSSFSVALRTGEVATRTLALRNAGVGTLDWEIPLPVIGGPGGAPPGGAQAPAEAVPGVPVTQAKGPSAAGAGGPDAFGYRYIDSDQPGGPEFVWDDLTLSGEGAPIDSLTTDDQISEAIPLGFTFPFYGQNYDSVRVSTNGFLTFTGTDAPYSNKPLPNVSAPPALVAPFWDDLDFDHASRAVFARRPDSFTVQYTGVLPYTGLGHSTFQVALHRTGEIVFRYLSMTLDTGSATIGIQDPSQSAGLLVAFNSIYLHDRMAIRIYNVPQWLRASPTSGRLFAGQGRDVTVTIDAQGLEGGSYAGTVFVRSNDPLQPLASHPVVLDVTPVPAIEVDPAWLDFGNVFAGDARTLELLVKNTGTDILNVGGLAPGDPAISAGPAAFSVAPRASQSVAVTFAPALPGTLDSTLVITSDAANAPALAVALRATSTPPPQMTVDPGAFSETLRTGSAVSRTLRLGNIGGSDLSVAFTAEVPGVVEWLRISPAAGTIPPGASRDFSVTMDAGDFGSTVLSGAVAIETNVPGALTASVPVTLAVIGAPNLTISDEPVVIVSQQTYSDFGARTVHKLPITFAPGGAAVIEVQVEGNYGSASETAQASVEGTLLGSVGNIGTECGTAGGTFPLGAAPFFAMALDGVIEVTVQNTPFVDTFCLADRHTVRLLYQGAQSALDYGSLFLGLRRSLAVALHNRGSETLKIQSIASDTPQFVPSASALNVPARTTATLTITFTPDAATPYLGALSIRSNDPDTPVLSIALRGQGLLPPVIEARPASLSTTLFRNNREIQALSVSNLGGNDLEFSVALKIRTPASQPASCAPTAYVSEYSAGRLAAVNLVTGATSAVAFGLVWPQENLVIDPAGATAFVNESDSGTLAAVDLATGSVTRVASGLNFPVGLALSPHGTTAYVSESRGARISAVDLSTGQTTPVAAGLDSPDGLALDAAATTLYFSEREAGRLSAVDLGTGAVSVVSSGLIGPSSIALDSGGTVAYVTETGSGRLLSIDLATGAKRTVSLGLEYPLGLALNSGRTAAYVAELRRGNLAMIDLSTGAVSRIGFGLSGPAGVAILYPSGCTIEFLSVDPMSGTLPPGGSIDLAVQFDSGDLFGGTYETGIEISSNDPITPLLRIPAYLTVNPICPDLDGDGYAVCSTACVLAGGDRCGDCDDAGAAVHPFVAEACNGLDDNCNGLLDEGTAGLDSDSDLIGDSCDNCAIVWNPDQRDTDANGTGDVCEAEAICGRANLEVAGFSERRVDGRDLADFARVFGTCPGPGEMFLPANLDLAPNGTAACVDLADFHLFMSAFARTCGGS
ncbi:MAG: S8 family serine peptidase [Acidobacteria bacterium]|nr:S8 family serine peptidase [Acidobacteriota bacterium]